MSKGFTSVRQDGRFEYAAAAAVAAGDVVLRPDGTLALYDHFSDAAIGDRIAPMPLRPFPVGEMPSASATVFAVGASVYWSPSTQLATATNTDTLVGRAARAKSNGQTTVLVNTDKP